MPDPTNWRSRARTRRNFIKAGAASGTILLAGCSGDDGTETNTDGDGNTGDGGGGDGGDGGGGQSSGERFRVFDPLTSGATPSARHFNPWNPTEVGCWHPGAAVFDRLAVYSPTQEEAYPLIAQSWEMPDDTTLEAELSDEWTWHNGDQFVAQDYVMEQEIETEVRRVANPDADRAHGTIESLEAVDDTFLRINLHDPMSEVFAVQNTIGSFHGELGRGVFTKHDDDQWSEWHDTLLNGDESEKEAAVEEITTTKYPMIDEGLGHGPFQVSEVGDDVIVCEKYEDHPNADNINFDEFALRLFSGSDEPTQPYASGQVDAAHKGFPVEDDLQSQMPEGHTLFREGRSSNKLFSFNCGYETETESPVNNVNVRKAVCHVFDRQQVTGLLQGVNNLFEWAPCRVPGKVLQENTHEAAQLVNEEFTLYGQNDTERATELLEGEGYERVDGTWMTPDGEEFQLRFMNGAERPDFNVLSQNLRDFGIAVEQEQVDDATFDERRQSGDYDLMPDGSSANGVSALWALDLVPDWIQSITHFEPETDVPMPIGDPDGANGTKTINVEEHIRQWQSTGESQYHHELLWWWNQTLPEMEAMWEPDAGAYDASNWELDVRDGIRNGVDDALYIAPKMSDGSLRYVGD